MDTQNLSLPTQPHPALLLSLPYFQLQDLLSSQFVCRQLRDTITADPLLWRHIIVAPPLSLRLTDEALLKLTSRAAGMLESLVLLDCWKISDAGLMTVARQNPGIVKLYIPGCTHLTADGMVSVIKQLFESKGNLKLLRLSGICNMTKEHLDICKAILSRNRTEEALEPSLYSYPFSVSVDNDDGPPIDVDICPKCKTICLVFGCTRDDCRSMRNRWAECRGCYICVARCENCGGCIDFSELGIETLCSHLLCEDCWLQRPKCKLCNKPYCNRHSEFEGSFSGSFVCEQCKDFDGSSGVADVGNFST